jgi:hypothetical protein
MRSDAVSVAARNAVNCAYIPVAAAVKGERGMIWQHLPRDAAPDEVLALR